MKRAAFIATVLLTSSCSYPMITENNWSKTVEAHRGRLTGSISVTDNENGWPLFTYDEVPSAQPVFIEKIDRDHWITVFERPVDSVGKKFSVEKLSETEYRLVIQK